MLNVVNQGASPLFATDTVVEAVVEVSRHGIVRRPCPSPPAAKRPLLLALERYQRTAAVAAATNELALACTALAENPLVGDLDRARALLERARRAYGEHIALLS